MSNDPSPSVKNFDRFATVKTEADTPESSGSKARTVVNIAFGSAAGLIAYALTRNSGVGPLVGVTVASTATTLVSKTGIAQSAINRVKTFGSDPKKEDVAVDEPQSPKGPAL